MERIADIVFLDSLRTSRKNYSQTLGTYLGRLRTHEEALNKSFAVLEH